MSERSANRRTMINLVCSILVLATNVIINFFLSPFIVENIGVEANGFVTLASNFVTYADLIVAALNSMAARFIAISYVKKDYKKANLYYNSVFWGNLLIVLILILPATIFILQLENFVNVPPELVFDVKLLFSFIFFNFFLTTGLPNYDCGTYVSNRLDRSYIPKMLSAILRCLLLFGIFTILTPKVWYVGLAATVVAIIILLCNAHNTHKLTPELRIKLRKSQRLYSWQAVKELVGSGIWNTISNVGNILLSGLDLIICNLYLGPTAMGILSISKLLPNYMQQLSGSIRDSFAPELTINYAQENHDLLLRNINRAMKVTSVIMTIPIAIIIVFGEPFFSLWVPSQDAHLLSILSVIAIFGYMFTSGTQILYNVFQVTNKVKQNAIAMVISGVASVGITIIFTKFTPYGLYAAAGVSTVCNLIRNMTFTLPATAKYLGFKWNIFYRQVLQTVFASILLVIIDFGLLQLFDIHSWKTLVFAILITACVNLTVNLILLLNKSDRQFLFGKVKKKVKRH